ncbi:hypothetical protein EDB87DRAFT_1619886 [Lactarius vividus]|nr:hypothetical protein EDB87DRAFT_1619886 [Lactarius vividus]
MVFTQHLAKLVSSPPSIHSRSICCTRIYFFQSPRISYTSFIKASLNIWSAGSPDLDLRRSMRVAPAYHQTTVLDTFTKGSHLFHDFIVLGVVLDLTLPGIWTSAHLTRAVRGLLDFFYLFLSIPYKAQKVSMCWTWHYDNFMRKKKTSTFPSFHSLAHYRRSITLFGSTDNYNTEQSERLHIDFTKDAYRTTNFKDEYK